MAYNYKIYRLVTLFIILHLYFFLGAIVYVYLEECDNEKSAKTCEDGCRYIGGINETNAEYFRSFCIEFQQTTTNRTHKKMTDICNDILQNTIHTKTNKNETVAKETDCTKWSLVLIQKWQVFCVVLLSTIGYGNVVPKTDGGKIFTIFYASVGVPLNLALLSSMAGTFEAILMSCSQKVQMNILKRKTFRHSNRQCAIISFILVLGVILGGAASSTHREMENLRFLDAVYFRFITVSTIGLGDFYYEPKRYPGIKILYTLPGYMLLILGMSVLASMINSMSKCIQEQAGKKVSISHHKHHTKQDVNET